MNIESKEPKTVLSVLLQGLRTCDEKNSGRKLPKSLDSKDFFGSPLCGLSVGSGVGSYPDLLLRSGKTYSREYPYNRVFEAARSAGSHVVIVGWPLEAAPNDVPEAMVMFLEFLRCLAAPISNTDPAQHTEEGMLQKDYLPRYYFFHQNPYSKSDKNYQKRSGEIERFKNNYSTSDDEEAIRKVIFETQKLQHGTALRHSVMKSYLLILLRELHTSNADISKSIFMESNQKSRKTKFVDNLRSISSMSGEWAAIVDFAAGFIGCKAYQDICIKHDYTATLKGLNIIPDLAGPTVKTSAGRKASVVVTGNQTRRFLGQPLPPIISAFIHFSMGRLGYSRDERAASGTRATVFAGRPENMCLLQGVLSDDKRLGRANDLLDTSEWKNYQLEIGGDSPIGEPSAKLARWACLCIVLEALISSSHAGGSAHESWFESVEQSKASEIMNENINHDLPDSDDQEPVSQALLEKNSLMMEQGLKELIKSSTKNNPTTREATRLACSDTGTEQKFVFTTVGMRRLCKNYFTPIKCPVERDPNSSVPIGTIWLPLPNALADNELELNVFVYFDDACQGGGNEMLPIDIRITDDFFHKEGILFALEPSQCDGFSLPDCLVDGEFDTVATLGVVGSAEHPESILVMIACIPNASYGSTRQAD